MRFFLFEWGHIKLFIYRGGNRAMLQVIFVEMDPEKMAASGKILD
jgi:hypothetical protein